MRIRLLTPLHTASISIAAVLLIIAVAAGFVRFSAPLLESHLTGGTMGTGYTVKYRHASDALSVQAIRMEIEQQLAKINQSMSTYGAGSELSRFNRSGSTEWIPVSTSLYTVLAAALEIGRQSEGAFDITIGPLVNLWGFGPEKRVPGIPNAGEIAATLERAGHDKLMLDESARAVRKTRVDVYVDLSAIAKGYAVDQIAATLERHGIEHYMVEIGGEIRARGTNAQQLPWQIGIDKPQVSGRTVQKVLPLDNAALATSGNYRNYFMIGDRRYMHVIDPATGWPAESRLASVTVLAETCMLADAWATALLVLGLERGLAMAEQLGLQVLFIADRGGVFTEHATSHFESSNAQNFAATFLAAFLVMAIAIAAMAIGVMMGRKPIAGSCGGLGRLGLGCDGGCGKPCSADTDCKPSTDKPEP
ncbi:thiamine biosynthesis lipoprotein [Nitrosomonas sp. Nm51]|uniref:FAD:protein FMN transferase n=1 Tax=Nitrosomonas sp. Nm51 TaxID=133720 RepID=UPI0008CFAA54|nr:FAD:protein FMN transferase [Nitrosomonas sp. Nm51]SER02765.1 thiamine biosynthesis lipoprotein [Nitrosomonas sp. Nm51]